MNCGWPQWRCQSPVHNCQMTAGVARPSASFRSLAVLVGAVVTGAVVLLVLPRSHPAATTYASASALAAAADLVAGMALISAALVVGLARPGRRLGVIALLCGIAWFAPDAVGWAGGPSPVRTIGMVVAPFFLPLIAYLVVLVPRARRVEARHPGIRHRRSPDGRRQRGAGHCSATPFLDAACLAATAPRTTRCSRTSSPFDVRLTWSGRGSSGSIGTGLLLVAIRRAVTANQSTSVSDPAGVTALAAGAVIGAAELGRVITLVGAPVEDPIDPVLSALFVTLAAAVTVLAGAVAATGPIGAKTHAPP